MVEKAILGTNVYYLEILNPEAPTQYDYWADITKSQIGLNWTPTVELQEGIKKYINFTMNE
jgi:nucleoside-diphosphate-sugar epimerase